MNSPAMMHKLRAEASPLQLAFFDEPFGENGMRRVLKVMFDSTDALEIPFEDAMLLISGNEIIEVLAGRIAAARAVLMLGREAEV